MDIIHQVDSHTRAVQRWLSSRAPTAVQIEGVAVQAQSTGLQIPLLNLALSGTYPDHTPDQTILAEIEQVKAFFLERGVPWYWFIGPSQSSIHLPPFLERCGLKSRPRPLLPALVAPLSSWSEDDYPQPKNLAVWPIQTVSDLETASKIRHNALQFPGNEGIDYFEAMASDWLAGDPAVLYLAGVKGEPPAAVGAMIMAKGIPGIYVMATAPQWRRNGLGKAVVHRIMHDAQIAGHQQIALTASPIGFLLYQQFGFKHIFDYQVYGS